MKRGAIQIPKSQKFFFFFFPLSLSADVLTQWIEHHLVREPLWVPPRVFVAPRKLHRADRVRDLGMGMGVCV
tara:strand:- start:310 stop:525 length:216 start_codon:yes stop_codon:yes gene_type:complete